MNADTYKTMTAHEAVGSHYVDNVYSFTSTGSVLWECMGYSKSGYAILFTRLEVLDDGKLRQINKYVDPDKKVYLWKKG